MANELKSKVEKSPACRMDGEEESKCVARKVSEMEAEGMDHEQAVAAATEMCKHACGEDDGDMHGEEAIEFEGIDFDKARDDGLRMMREAFARGEPKGAPAIVGKHRDLAMKVWLGVATDEDLRGAKVEDVIAIKSDGEHVHRAITRRKPRGIDREKREVEHVASDETVDRMGDVIRVKGWQLDSFKQNPVVLWDHKSGDPPIGTAVQVWKDLSGEDPFLGIRSRFFDAAKYEFADLIARMVMDGDLQAGSVGFLPLATTRPETQEARTKLGLGQWGVLYDKAELLEWSIVTVPANPGALMRKLGQLVEDGTVPQSLASDAVRAFTGSARTSVAIARGGIIAPLIAMREVDALSGADLVKRLDALAAQVGEVKNILGAELPALKESIGSVARGAALRSALGASNVSPQVPADDSREHDPAAFYKAALGAVKAKKQ